jgi:hypothetical protein
MATSPIPIYLLSLASVAFWFGCNKQTPATNVDASTSGLVASNGVPIPGPDLRDTCGHLGVQTRACSPTAPCEALTCICDGVTQTIAVVESCEYNRCLTAVSCPAFCELKEKGRQRLNACVYNGTCKSATDCTLFPNCLRAPGSTLGQCESEGTGAECFTDGDCLSSVCVALAEGRQCGDGTMFCNLDSQCQAGACALPDDGFSGLCTNGANSSFCFKDAHCQPGLKCIVFENTSPRCSTQGKGAPCDTNADCNGGFCVRGGGGSPKGTCDTGEAGATCNDAAQCKVPFCVQNGFGAGFVCTTGKFGDPCTRDTHCISEKCSAGSGFIVGQCTDGQLSHACRDSVQCEAGLHCTANAGGGTCANP